MHQSTIVATQFLLQPHACENSSLVFPNRILHIASGTKSMWLVQSWINNALKSGLDQFWGTSYLIIICWAVIHSFQWMCPLTTYASQHGAYRLPQVHQLWLKIDLVIRKLQIAACHACVQYSVEYLPLDDFKTTVYLPAFYMYLYYAFHLLNANMLIL